MLALKATYPFNGRTQISIPLIAVAAVAFHTLVSITHGGPVAVPDVSAYLSISQWLNGGLLPEPLNYHPGYGLLLAPLGWLNGNDLHAVALIFNGLLAGGIVLLVAKFARRLGLPNHLVTLAALLAAVHPSTALSSRIAWPETLILLIILSVTLLLFANRWLIAGLVSTVAICVHPRLIVLTLAIIVTGIYIKELKKTALGFIVGIVVVVVVLTATNTWPDARVQAARSIGSGPSPIATTAGQWLAFAASSLGLCAIGLFESIKRALGKKVEPGQLFLVISTVAMVMLGGWVLAGSDRPDTLMYSRYIAPWTLPLSIIGLRAASQRVLQWRTLVLVSGLSVSCSVTVWLQVSEVTGPVRQIMTLDLAALWSATSKSLTSAVFGAALLTAIGCWSFYRFGARALIVLLIFSTASSAIAHVKLHDVGVISEGQYTTAQYVPEGTECLAHDATVKSYALWLYRLQLPTLQHRRVDLGKRQKPCSAYLVTSEKVLDQCSHAELVAQEPRAQWGLWHYPATLCN